MLVLNEQLARSKGFEYGLCSATNVRTASALARVGYEKVAEGDASVYELNGVKCFALVEKENKL